MPENEFEHRVQQKMEDFQLRPSDQVWSEVNRRIRQENRRRFIFWWFLLAFILAGGIGTAVWLNGKQKKETGITGNNNKEAIINTSVTSPEQTTAGQDKITNIIHDTTTNKPLATKIESRTNHVNNTNAVPADQTSPASVSIVKRSLPAAPEKVSARRKQIAASAQSAEVAFAEQGGQVKKKKTNTVPEKKVVVAPITPASNNETAATVIKENSDKTASTAVTDTASISTLPSPVLVQAMPAQNTVKQDTTIVDSTITVSLPSLSFKKSKWEWDVSVSVGRSSLVYGFGKFKQASLMDAAQGLGGLGTTPPTASVNLQPAKSGLSFGINAYARKTVTDNLDFIIGLGYNYYSTQMKVGEKVDSTRSLNNSFSTLLNVGSFYRPAGTASGQTYTNRYHFTSLSAELSWKIIRGNKFNIYWRNGLQYSHLLGSSMLHYDNAIPGYYQDNSQLKKGHLFFLTGLSVPVGKRWQFNPYFNYGLTIVLNNGESRTHYNSAGLRVIFSLPKNK